MSLPDDLAFPLAASDENSASPGMTVFEWFFSQALAGAVANHERHTPDEIVEHAYAVAALAMNRLKETD